MLLVRSIFNGFRRTVARTFRATHAIIRDGQLHQLLAYPGTTNAINVLLILLSEIA
jgi:hypothetical protein